MALKVWLLLLAATIAALGAPMPNPLFESPGWTAPVPPPAHGEAFGQSQAAPPQAAPIAAVPEPGTIVLVGGCGLLAMAWRRRRARRTLLFPELPENVGLRRQDAEKPVSGRR